MEGALQNSSSRVEGAIKRASVLHFPHTQIFYVHQAQDFQDVQQVTLDPSNLPPVDYRNSPSIYTEANTQ
jgi:hypothetical protein